MSDQETQEMDRSNKINRISQLTFITRHSHSAGRDTTALTLTWQFYSLMANPRVLKNVLKEIEVVLRGSEVYSYETMTHGLPYLKAVFHETLRLYPQGSVALEVREKDKVVQDMV